MSEEPRVIDRRPAHDRLARRALGVGLAALIPLPFIDEIIRKRLLRSSYRHAAADAGVSLSPDTLRALTLGQGSLLWAIAKAILVWPIKKLFKTILYFLTIKDVLDWTTEAALRAEMVHMAAKAGALPAGARQVAAQMDATLERHRFSPVTRWLRGPRRPPMVWPQGADPLLGGVGTLVALGGGASVLAAFEETLKEGSAPVPALVPAPAVEG